MRVLMARAPSTMIATNSKTGLVLLHHHIRIAVNDRVDPCPRTDLRPALVLETMLQTLTQVFVRPDVPSWTIVISKRPKMLKRTTRACDTCHPPTFLLLLPDQVVLQPSAYGSSALATALARGDAKNGIPSPEDRDATVPPEVIAAVLADTPATSRETYELRARQLPTSRRTTRQC